MEILFISSELDRKIFERIARKCRCSYELITRGTEALNIRKKKIDVVLWDTSVNDIKVNTLITKIKKEFPQSKIILVVESDFSELESTDKDEKIDYYLIKPLNENYLENIINHISNKINFNSKRIKS